MDKPIVIKVGGNDLDEPGFLPELAGSVAAIQRERPCIVVHGGGRSINAMLDRLGIVPQYHQGQRITDEATLEITMMVLCGSVNKAITSALLDAGVDALGLSGIDRGLLTVRPWDAHMGRVGRVVRVNAPAILDLCRAGVLPVIAPISKGPEGAYNVNADHAAGAVAGAVEAVYAAFVSNVAGVQNGQGLIPHLRGSEVQALIDEGVIHGGMIPKVRAALDALAQGVGEARITNLPGLREGSGTRITE
jgi:acetylglutamate kinase